MNNMSHSVYLWTAGLLLTVTLATTEDVLWSCDHLSHQVEREEEAVVSHLPPDVAGKWVSESCEIRPGPEFILRSYQFENRRSSSGQISFRLQQFYYGESSCLVPLYVVNSWGYMYWKQPSWLVVGAQEAEYSLSRVTLLAYSPEMAIAFSNRINASCNGLAYHPWRAFRPYIVWSEGDGTVDQDCLSVLHLVFHELQLTRVEQRPLRHRHPRAPSLRHELLLGDIHTRLDQRAQHRPTSYQSPLIKSTETNGCYVCRIVDRSDDHSPPHLHVTPHLPIHLSGEWLSQRCETRPYGTFILRRVRFVEKQWQGVYQFFADPACAVPTLRVFAEGGWQAHGPSTVLHGAWDVDFKMSAVTITPLDVGTVHNLNGHPPGSCGGNDSWILGQTKDVTSTHGCAGLGIQVPSIHYEVARLSVDAYGEAALFLGLPDSYLHPYSSDRRPTAYQNPLIQCQERPEEDNNLGPIPNAIYSKESSATTFSLTPIILFLLISSSTAIRWLHIRCNG